MPHTFVSNTICFQAINDFDDFTFLDNTLLIDSAHQNNLIAAFERTSIFK